jgi:hypothetical protein
MQIKNGNPGSIIISEVENREIAEYNTVLLGVLSELGLNPDTI